MNFICVVRTPLLLVALKSKGVCKLLLSTVLIMSTSNVFMLDWNVRGLNQPIRRQAVRDMVASTGATIVCLQETKLEQVDDVLIRETLGNHFVGNYSFLAAEGSRGGIIVAADMRHFAFLSSSATQHTLTVLIQMLDDGEEWALTGVYGPPRRRHKQQFLQELQTLHGWVERSWLIAGDFNLIYKASDKNNSRLDRRLMARFRNTIQQLELKEINLHGRKFTWSNGQERPTMTKIDRCFSNVQWEEKFPTCHLQALASTLSDHCPLFLQGNTNPNKFRGFRFENFWVHMPGFQEVVQETWAKPVQATDAVRKLHIKLSRVAKALKKWQKDTIGNIRMQTLIAKEVLWLLDVTEERRELTQQERQFRERMRDY